MIKKNPKEDNTTKINNIEIEECLGSVKALEHNLLNVKNLLQDNFEFLKSKNIIDDDKIENVAFKIDKIYEKLILSQPQKSGSVDSYMKDILSLFFDKYYLSLNKLHEILETLNSYKIDYKKLLDFLLNQIRYIYLFLQIVEILKTLTKSSVDNNYILQDIQKFKNLSDKLSNEIENLFNQIFNSDNAFLNKFIYSSHSFEELLANIYIYLIDSENIIATINASFNISLLEMGLDKSIYSDVNSYYKKIENELLLFKNLLKNRLMIDEKSEIVYNNVDGNDDFVVSDSDLDARISVLKNEINKKINQIKNDKQMVSDSAEFVLGLLKK